MAVSTYIVPQVRVFQEFAFVPDEITDSLRALIAGPHAHLSRYSDPDEKDGAFVGAYMPDADNVFGWPARPPGGTIDESYVKVFIEDARLRFFQDLIGEDEVVTPVAGSKDRISIAGTRGWKLNGTSPRLLGLGDRDVRVGDKVNVRGVVGAINYSLDSYVSGLAADPVAAVLGTAEPDPDNWEDQPAANTPAQESGEDNTVALTADTSGYSAYHDGDLREVYTIEVVQGSSGSDLETGLLRVTSASGHDDDLQVQPAASGTAFAVGKRGLKLTFTKTGNDNLMAGQRFTLTVDDEYTAVAGAASGVYTGAAGTTYVFECVRGGNFADPDPALRPQMRTYTTTGVDSSQPITLNLAATPYLVGTKGVIFTFTGAPVGIAKGDKFYIAVEAAAEGRISTLVLAHNLPATLLTATDLDVALFVNRDVQVDRDLGGGTGWTPEVQQVVVHGGLTVHDEEFAVAGEPAPLPVVGGRVYVEYRAWLEDHVDDVGSIYDVGQLDAVISGPLHPDNPLKWGVYKALSNANGTQVRFTAVEDPTSLDAWVRMLALLVGREDIYNIVPLTHDREVQNLVAAHCNAQSSPENKAWRACFLNLKAGSTAVAVDATRSSNGQIVQARLQDDPNQQGTQNVLLTVTTGNGNLATNKVRPGDVVRTSYAIDAGGDVVWDEFIVDEVLNEDSLLLVDGPVTPISVPQKIEVWHRLTKAEIAADLAMQAGSFGSRRVKAVWPDQVGSGGVTQPGYFLCCALAGLRSGVVPHQGLTNLEIAGFDDLSRTTKFLNGEQLNAMAQSGAWIVTQNPSGEVFTRHALTTDRTGVETSEEMFTANIDSVSYLYARRLAPYIGLMNVTPDALLILEAEIDSIIGFLRSQIPVARLGPQIIDAEVVQIRRHAFLADTVVATVRHEFPFPLNYLELHVVV